MAFLLEEICQYQNFPAIEETEKPKGVTPNVYSDFPYIICVDQFLNIFWGNLV